MGRLMKNTQRHPSNPRMLDDPAKAPPTTGPSTEDMPKTDMKYPWYLARSLRATMSPMMVRARARRPPAPRPWMPRARASSVIEWTDPAYSEPARKIMIAVRYRGRRPKMSLSLPYRGVLTVEVMRYAVVAQAWRESPSRSLAM